jgi:hypothetical protein
MKISVGRNLDHDQVGENKQGIAKDQMLYVGKLNH